MISLLISLSLFISVASGVLFIQKRTLCSQELTQKSFEKATPFLLEVSARNFKEAATKKYKHRSLFFSCDLPYQVLKDHQAVYLETTKISILSELHLPKEARTPKKQRVLWALP